MADRVPLIIELLTATGVGAALGKVVESLMKGRTPKKDYLEAVAQTADLLMDGMRADLNDLRGVVAAQAREIRELKDAHAECEQRCDALTAARRDDRQLIESLIRQLRDPKAALAVELNAGAVTPLIPEKRG